MSRGYDADPAKGGGTGTGQMGEGRSSVRHLSHAYRELSARYRSGADTPPDGTLTADHVRAYVAARLPATLAVSRAVLAEVAARRPDWQPASLLDLGAGPGTAAHAAAERYPGLARVDLVERSALMIDAGRRLARADGPPALRAARWHRGDVQIPPPVTADLTVAAYLLGELPAARRSAAVAAWWRATAGELVLIDTGTPAGFARILAARTALLAAGATITAPCPADGACPLPRGDWCHFARRVERSALHRTTKDAALGHEDEKYTYLVASRQDPAHAGGRVLRAPAARSGHVRLLVCAPDGRRDVVVARSAGADYRWARRARWGDAAPLLPAARRGTAGR
ncbi:ribosomal methyltransferase Rsm22 [Frankia torreyi]|uniref:Ribosomal methyltransferase Rsm22 n=2 Tax=Frankia TaxID=1854 RepID=A0A0D8BLV1_9ACTN|nr:MULTISPECIES: small ribosomal subunit Rsm22 family protein [Frankia]KJE25126.1 ribosomal methyltransferase Rsm22 [Frankia torreyi]KQM08058.1 ribosomal methyltransferase Rsm22 [Frankia sp. CpI1-P]